MPLRSAKPVKLMAADACKPGRNQSLAAIITMVTTCAGCSHTWSAGEVLTYSGVGTTLVGTGLLTDAYAGDGGSTPPALGWSTLGIGIALTAFGLYTMSPADLASATATARARAQRGSSCAAQRPAVPCTQGNR